MTWRPRHLFPMLALAMTLLPLARAGAETVEELKAKLAAQEQVNELLKQRISTLEAELSGRRAAPAAVPAPPPERAADDPEEDRALERTLVHRGTALLPANTLQLTPSLVWSHAGSGFDSSVRNLYGAGLDVRYGLPGGWMLGAAVPFLHRDAAAGGDNSGIGDISATVWKSLLSEQADRPSLIASIRYVAPTGDGLASALPLGSGFHSATVRVSAVKTVAPIAFYGELAYTRYLGETLNGASVRRDGAFGFDLGANLAVTPDISLTAGLAFDFEDGVTVNGWRIDGSARTRGVVEIGAGVLLRRNLFLIFTGAFGVTADAPDVALGVSLPFRF